MIYLAFGGNVSALYHGQILTVSQTFRHVLEVLDTHGITPIKASSIWKSPAWPDASQPAYLNAVLSVQTDLKPLSLLGHLKNIEQKFGRKQSRRNANRPLDLDILDYQGRVMNHKKLQLPHPRMLERAFVLFPLAEVSPNWHDPIKKRAITDWIARLELHSVEPLQRLGPLT